MRTLLTATACSLAALTACGGSDDASSDAADEPVEASSDAGSGDDDGSGAVEVSGIATVPPAEAAEVVADPPDDLVILDVRTQEEFEEVRIEGATMLDFYRDDFAEALEAEFDPDVPYVLYCRSGNRSGQALEIMRELGFTDVLDVDGGIVGWVDAGLPTVSG